MTITRSIALAALSLSGLGVFAASAAEQQPATASGGADRLSGMIIYTADLDRSIWFYTDVMGLKTVGKVEKDGKLAEILLSKSGGLLEGADLVLQPTDNQPERADPKRFNFGVILFMTSSNTALAQQLRTAGYEPTVRDAQHLLVKDPDGYRIMVYQVGDQIKPGHN